MPNHSEGTDAYIVLNILSFFCSIWVFVTMLLIVLYRPRVCDYFSAKLQMWIGLLEMSRHVQRIMAMSVEDGGLCTAVGFYGQLSIYFYVIIQAITAYNLSAHFIDDDALSDSSRRNLFIGGFSAAGFFSLVALGLGGFGLDHASNCMYAAKLDPDGQAIVRIYLVYLPLLPFYLYSVIMPAYVVYRLCPRKEEDFVAVVKRMFDQEASPGMRAFIRTMCRRIITFTINSLLTLGGFFFHFLLLDICKRPIGFFQVWYSLGLASSGILNLIGLMFHPSFSPAVFSLYCGEAEKTVDDYDPLPGIEGFDYDDVDTASVYSDNFAIADEPEKVVNEPSAIPQPHQRKPPQPPPNDEAIHIEIRKFNPIDMPATSKPQSIKPAMDML